MRPTRTAILALAAGVGLALASCAHGAHTDAQPAPGPGPELATALEVRNNTWNDVDVFVYAGTHRVRVGDVVSMGAVHLVLPSDVLGGGPVQVRTEPVGGGTPFMTDRIDIRRGQRIRLVVEGQGSLSSWTVDEPATGW